MEYYLSWAAVDPSQTMAQPFKQQFSFRIRRTTDKTGPFSLDMIGGIHLRSLSRRSDLASTGGGRGGKLRCSR
jgi:hypothetical protein